MKSLYEKVIPKEFRDVRGRPLSDDKFRELLQESHAGNEKNVNYIHSREFNTYRYICVG